MCAVSYLLLKLHLYVNVSTSLYSLKKFFFFVFCTGALGRMLMFIMFFVFLFLYTSYSANIVALLQSTSDQIRTLSDLLNSKLELGVEDTPYNRYFFSVNHYNCELYYYCFFCFRTLYIFI